MFVNVDDGIRAEIDRIGTRDPCAVVLIRIEDLHGHRFPTAGRATVKKARPSFADAAKTLLDLRNQLVRDRVAVWTKIRGVDGV